MNHQSIGVSKPKDSVFVIVSIESTVVDLEGDKAI